MRKYRRKKWEKDETRRYDSPNKNENGKKDELARDKLKKKKCRRNVVIKVDSKKAPEELWFIGFGLAYGAEMMTTLLMMMTTMTMMRIGSCYMNS